MKPGDKVLVTGRHPHSGTTGRLVSYGPYGLDFLKLEGWHVQLDGNYGSCYAKEHQLQKLPR